MHDHELNPHHDPSPVKRKQRKPGGPKVTARSRTYASLNRRTAMYRHSKNHAKDSHQNTNRHTKTQPELNTIRVPLNNSQLSRLDTSLDFRRIQCRLAAVVIGHQIVHRPVPGEHRPHVAPYIKSSDNVPRQQPKPSTKTTPATRHQGTTNKQPGQTGSPRTEPASYHQPCEA